MLVSLKSDPDLSLYPRIVLFAKSDKFDNFTLTLKMPKLNSQTNMTISINQKNDHFKFRMMEERVIEIWKIQIMSECQVTSGHVRYVVIRLGEMRHKAWRSMVWPSQARPRL